MTNATFAVHTTLKYNLQHTINFKCYLSSYMSLLLYEKRGKIIKKKIIHDSEKLSTNLFTNLNNLWLK